MFRGLILLIMLSFSSLSYAKSIDDIVELLKNNKISSVTQYFDERVEINLYNKVTQYPKAQATTIVKEFFKGKSISNLIVTAKNDKGSYKYCKAEIQLSNTKYKIKFTTNASVDSFVITSFSVETG